MESIKPPSTKFADTYTFEYFNGKIARIAGPFTDDSETPFEAKISYDGVWTIFVNKRHVPSTAPEYRFHKTEIQEIIEDIKEEKRLFELHPDTQFKRHLDMFNRIHDKKPAPSGTSESEYKRVMFDMLTAEVDMMKHFVNQTSDDYLTEAMAEMASAYATLNNLESEF